MVSLLSQGLHVQPTTIAALEASPNIWPLLAEYAEEAAVKGLPPPAIRAQTYKSMEAAGVLHPFSALLDGELVGYITVLASEMPHYCRTIAITESFFVGKAYRGSGAGLRLLEVAEAKAAELGSPVLFVSAPFEGNLFKVLPRRGYTEASRIFYKAVAHG